MLSGLLAEEDDFDRRALWRLGSWGVGAVAAVVIAVMANQTSLGWRRDQVATADLAQQAQQIQHVAKESQNEARRLASAIDTLNSDRDRLYTRVTVLEQGLDSVTGAIARQNSGRPAAETTCRADASPAVAPVDHAAARQRPTSRQYGRPNRARRGFVRGQGSQPRIRQADIPKRRQEAEAAKATKPQAAQSDSQAELQS